MDQIAWIPKPEPRRHVSAVEKYRPAPVDKWKDDYEPRATADELKKAEALVILAREFAGERTVIFEDSLSRELGMEVALIRRRFLLSIKHKCGWVKNRGQGDWELLPEKKL